MLFFLLLAQVALRSTAVAVNFGAPGKRPWKELPFQVRMLDDAAGADVRDGGVAALGGRRFSDHVRSRSCTPSCGREGFVVMLFQIGVGCRLDASFQRLHFITGWPKPFSEAAKQS